MPADEKQVTVMIYVGLPLSIARPIRPSGKDEVTRQAMMYRTRESLGRGVAACLLTLLGACAMSAQSAETYEAKRSASPTRANSEWRLLGGNADQWQHSTLTQINDKNVVDVIR
jgi:glucose dehydrogenase